MQRFSSSAVVSTLAALLAACGSPPTEDGEDGTGSGDPPQLDGQPDPALGTLSSAATAAPICTSATSSSGWVGASIGKRTGTFTVSVDATPSANPSDMLFGLSSGVATTYADLATIVRFNTAGAIDVRNGSSYGADRFVLYDAGTTYHFKLDVNTVTHTYSVRLTTSGVDIPLATNFAFRTEQANVAMLGRYAAKVDAGDSLSLCGVTVAVPGNCRVATPGGGFVNKAFARQSVFTTATFTATPGADGMDGVVGLSAAPAAAFTDLAAAIRFNPAGTIDVRGPTGYAADIVVPYTAGRPYTFQLLADVLGHSYSVLLGGEVLARAYGFRSEQSGVASLANQAQIVDSTTGPLTVCGVRADPPKGVRYVHDMQSFGPASPPRSLAALPNGTLLMADQSRTLTLDALGKVIGTSPHGGFVAADNAGNAYLVGEFQGTYDGGGGPLVSAGGTDVYVSKYGPGWNHLWSRTFGGTGDDLAARPAVNGRGDLALKVGPSALRLNADGTTAWTLPSSAADVAVDTLGNALFAENPPPAYSVTISKIDRAANPVWVRQFPVTDGGATVQFIRSDPGGNVILVGGLNGTIDFGTAELAARSSEGEQVFVVKLDPSGTYVYGAIGYLGIIRSVVVDSGGNTLVGGYHINVDYPVLDKFGPTGTLLTERTGTNVSPLFFLGSSGALATDRSRNIYWEVSPRIGSGGLDYLVKLAP